ncbi:hypothetical protein FIV34_06735 [Luteibacter pinisoli]|uniref:Uncharacterized protein n=1 Tax=Luteibacter pinisoli TaxID=2589080 RepID=A0A4Y5Z1I4_9GAMM|nr:hypothetical protein [Luteibacter pinisoli]QDE38917.1 hypothetical protein FIV34_06735 [Luteibacter pinisoli]
MNRLHIALAASFAVASLSGVAQAAATLPVHHRDYATAPIDGGHQCKVGIATDADGMHAKGLVYVTDGKSITWSTTLKLPEFTEQARATHCVQSGKSLYVLVQGDTNTSPSLSQTLMNVAQLDATTGKVQAMEYVDLADVKGAFSASVETDASHFRVTTPETIEVTGKYVLTDAPDASHDFKVTVKIPLAK